ncbi:SDR family NAD(P)-dependent oxidoreductase [Nocardia sp. NPDC050630]|uniref:SDR family NAD(P)-dependent oxidoreductase n=1 Tax=Nocardia sp. NPDC050630 TaxID=3364321 RepID=UPI0037B77882
MESLLAALATPNRTERHHEQGLVCHRLLSRLRRNFAEAALSRGDKVAATARSTEHLTELVAAYGDAVLGLELDVTDRAQVFETVKRADEHFGRLNLIGTTPRYVGLRRLHPDPRFRRPGCRRPRAPRNRRLRQPALRVFFGSGGNLIVPQVYATGSRPGPHGRASRWRLEGTRPQPDSSTSLRGRSPRTVSNAGQHRYPHHRSAGPGR